MYSLGFSIYCLTCDTVETSNTNCIIFRSASKTLVLPKVAFSLSYFPALWQFGSVAFSYDLQAIGGSGICRMVTFQLSLLSLQTRKLCVEMVEAQNKSDLVS